MGIAVIRHHEGEESSLGFSNCPTQTPLVPLLLPLLLLLPNPTHLKVATGLWHQLRKSVTNVSRAVGGAVGAKESRSRALSSSSSEAVRRMRLSVWCVCGGGVLCYGEVGWTQSINRSSE
jgi:hypothetical protein